MHSCTCGVHEKCNTCTCLEASTDFCYETNTIAKKEKSKENDTIKARLMPRTIKKTLFMWGKGRGDKCCPRPESCLPHARPVLEASVNEWHITGCDESAVR